MVNNNELVSIIVPVYNSEKYLYDCIKSILSQTYTNLELILVNDGSKDNSLQIMMSFEAKDSRIIILNQNNQGVTVARKNGVNKASGVWIFFCDSDDILPPTSIDVLYKNVSNADIVVGGVHFEGQYQWPYLKQNKTYDRYKYIESLILGKIEGGPWSKLIKKDLFDTDTFDFPVSIKLGEDYLMNLAIANNIQKFVQQIPDITYVYIQRPTFHPSDARNRLLKLKYKVSVLLKSKNIYLVLLQVSKFFFDELKLLGKKILGKS